MDNLFQLSDYIIHFDKYLSLVLDAFGPWTYLILFAIVFAESGLIITPFLPGDPLLFVVGALSASGAINLWTAIIILMTATIAGNIVNYHIGKILGPRIFQKDNVKVLNKKHLKHANEYCERHGEKTILFARFLPIIRTFAPFLAGMGNMNYLSFMIYNIIGGILWVSLLMAGGYFLGNIPFVESNLALVIMAIILISMLPGLFAFINGSRMKLSKDKV